MTPHMPLLAVVNGYRWFDVVLLVVAAGCFLLWLFVAGSDVLSSTIYKSRKIYTDIIQYLRLQCGKPVDPAYLTELETVLGPINYKAAGWRDTLLRKLQEASAVADHLDDKKAAPLNQLICERLGDLVQRTAEVATANQRRRLVDQIKVEIAVYPE